MARIRHIGGPLTNEPAFAVLPRLNIIVRQSIQEARRVVPAGCAQEYELTSDDLKT